MTIVAVRGVESVDGGMERVDRAVSFTDLAGPGQLVEVSGGAAAARITTAVALVRRAQLEGETTAWIQPLGGPLFPPDLADSGVDLDALIVVHIPVERGPAGIARAAELLLRSGGYGLCVLDLSAPASPPASAGAPLEHDLPDMTSRPCPNRLHGSAWQARLAGLARAHASRVVLLTRGSERRDSLGPLVGLRLHPRRERRGPGLFAVRPDVLKHKGGSPAAPVCELRRGPWGLS